MNVKKQKLKIPADWKVLRNEFHDIDPFDSHSAEVKDVLIFTQEDMLWIQKENYNIDMGWYGGDDLTNEYTGFCIYLYRGDHWNKCELLEKFRSQRKEEIVTKLNYFIEAVVNNEYKELTGHNVNEDDPTNRNTMEDFHTFSVR